LDFIPGGGFEAQIAGVGPRYRQYRIVVGLDLSLTETRTGRIVANVPLQKQIVASEAGFGVGRFFGDTLVSLDMGTQRREAVSFALRQMLNLATYELLTQLMKPELYSACSNLIAGVHGVVNSGRASRKRVITIPAPGELLPGSKPVASKPPPVEPAVPANGTPAVPVAAASGVDSLRPAASEVAAPSRAAQLQLVGGVAMEPAGQGSDAFVAVPTKPALNTPPTVEPQPQASGGLASVVMPEAPAKPEPEAKPAAVAPEPKEVPEPKEPPVSEVKVEPAVIATAPAVEAPPAVVEAAPASVEAPPAVFEAPPRATEAVPALVVADTEKAVDATCSYPSGPSATVRPTKGFKSGNMVYVESDTASSLCVVDASGKFTRHQFKPGKGQVFNGRPPWKLSSPDLLSMRIYFQGVNLARFMPNSTSIVLQEAAAPQASGDLASVVMPAAVAPVPRETPVSEVKVESAVIATAPAVEAPPAAPTPVVAVKEKAVEATCSYPTGPFATVRPTKGFKAGDMVFVESDTASSLCVVDATGKFTRHQFKPGKGQFFNGRPPWKLSSPDLLSMRIYFQGANLARVMPNSTSILLQEAAVPIEQ